MHSHALKLRQRFKRASVITEIKVQDEDLMFRRHQLKNHNKPKSGLSSQGLWKSRVYLNLSPIFAFNFKKIGRYHTARRKYGFIA